MLSSVCTTRRALCHSRTLCTDPAGGGNAATIRHLHSCVPPSLLLIRHSKAEMHSEHSNCVSRHSDCVSRGWREQQGMVDSMKRPAYRLVPFILNCGTRLLGPERGSCQEVKQDQNPVLFGRKPQPQDPESNERAMNKTCLQFSWLTLPGGCLCVDVRSSAAAAVSACWYAGSRGQKLACQV